VKLQVDAPRTISIQSCARELPGAGRDQNLPAMEISLRGLDAAAFRAVTRNARRIFSQLLRSWGSISIISRSSDALAAL
jgi:hypothetical protein